MFVPHLLLDRYDPEDAGDDDDSDDDAPDLRVAMLKDLPGGGIVHGQQVDIVDLSQDTKAKLNIVNHSDWDDKLYPDHIFVGQELPKDFYDQAKATLEEQEESDSPPRKVLRKSDANND